MRESRQNKIAVLFDYDLTLTKEYSENPVFRHYGFNPDEFWREVPKYFAREQRRLRRLEARYGEDGMPPRMDRTGMNRGLAYLHLMIKYVESGRFRGLSKGLLRELGQQIPLCDGLWEGLSEMKEMVKANPKWSKHEIEIELYIVSASITDLIDGSLGKHGRIFKGRYANEVLPKAGKGMMSEIKYIAGPVTDTQKTRTVYEILKGSKLKVNERVPEEEKRISGKNSVMVGDGFQDVPAMATVKDKGGRVIGVYTGMNQEETEDNRKKAEKLLKDERVEIVLPADYRQGSELRNYLEGIFSEMADRIVSSIEEKKIIFMKRKKEEEMKQRMIPLPLDIKDKA